MPCNGNAAPPGRANRLDGQQKPFARAGNRQTIDHAHARHRGTPRRMARRIATAVHHPLHILHTNRTPARAPRHGGGHLHHVHRLPAIARVAADVRRLRARNRKTEPLRRALRDGCQFLRLERAEKNFYAARAQSRREFRWRARRGAHQAKVRRHAVVKHVVNPTWRSGIVGIVISAFKAHHAVFQHLEQFVHLHGMQLPDFIQKKHPAMRPA